MSPTRSKPTQSASTLAAVLSLCSIMACASESNVAVCPGTAWPNVSDAPTISAFRIVSTSLQARPCVSTFALTASRIKTFMTDAAGMTVRALWLTNGAAASTRRAYAATRPGNAQSIGPAAADASSAAAELCKNSRRAIIGGRIPD